MIKVKLHFIGVKKRLYNSIDKLSGVIVAPKDTILGNPEEVMFKRTGYTDYHEIAQYQKDFIRQWCAVNRMSGSDLTLAQVDKIIELADYQEQKIKELKETAVERSKSEGKDDCGTEESIPGDGNPKT